MTVALVADVHVGNHQQLGGRHESGLNRRAHMVLDCLGRAVALANDKKARHFVVAGDLFDTVRPSPQMIAAVMEELKNFEGDVHLLLGNHDMVSTAEGDHALAPLAELPNVRVWEQPGCIVDEKAKYVVGFVPFRPGHGNAWFKTACAEAFLELDEADLEWPRCIVTHLGLRAQSHLEMGPWMAAAHDAVDVTIAAEAAVENHASHIYAGNWHGRAVFTERDVTLVQIGTLCPTGWDNPGTEGYGSVDLWGPKAKLHCIEVPGPRFVYRIPAERDKLGNLTMACLRADPREMPSVRAMCERAVEQKLLHGYVVEPADEQAREQARQKVEQAVSVGLLERSVMLHLEQSPPPKAVDADEVRQTCLRMLASAPGHSEEAGHSALAIRHVEMHNFMCHKDLTVELPEHGLVVVTGPNGTGKSSIVEAVSVGLWGRSLRGGVCWNEGKPGGVSIVHDKLLVTRSVDKRGSKVLAWQDNGAPAREFDTQTKAQQALETEIGTHDSWRRTHVFSSQDAAHFTLSTDAERKALLEELLGLGAFDAAYDMAAAEHKQAAQKADFGKQALVQATERFRYAKNLFESAEFVEEPPLPPTGPKPDVGPSRDKLKEVQQKVRDARSAPAPDAGPLQRAQESVNRAQAELKQLKARQARLAAGNCPECDQPIPGAMRASQQDEIDRVERELADAATWTAEERELRQKRCDEWAKLVDDAQRELDAATEEKHEVDRILDQWLMHEKNLAAWAGRRDTALARRDEHRLDWVAAEEKVSELEDQQANHQAKAAHYEAVREVLGLRGARVRVLSEALAGVEQVANVWMGRFFSPDAALELRGTSELKSGKTVGAIALFVRGVGAGQGYTNLSGGERRRVDAALLMALAEVSSAASGRKPGTIFMDEVFDALDERGIEQVKRELVELSAHRCVVLITHDKELAAGLPAASRIRMGEP